MTSNELPSIETESTFFRYDRRWHGQYWNLSVLCKLVQRELKTGSLVSLVGNTLEYFQASTAKTVYIDESLDETPQPEVYLKVPRPLKSDDRDCVSLYAEEWTILESVHDKLNKLVKTIDKSLHDEYETRISEKGEIRLYNLNDRRVICCTINPFDFYSYMTYGVSIPVPIPMRAVREEAL